MVIRVSDIVAFSEARSQLSRLVDEVQHGAEKIITKNGEPAVAMIDASGLDDVEAGRTVPAGRVLEALRQRRASKVRSAA